MIKRENAELLKKSISGKCVGFIPRAGIYEILAVEADLLFANDYMIDRFIDMVKSIPSADVVEVAREIFEELETHLCYTTVPVIRADGTIGTRTLDGMHIRNEDYETIKKKYTEGEG
jgi:GTP:adenosylcobinamide-phosphate guanylyltransferase